MCGNFEHPKPCNSIFTLNTIVIIKSQFPNIAITSVNIYNIVCIGIISLVIACEINTTTIRFIRCSNRIIFSLFLASFFTSLATSVTATKRTTYID